jgi:hypothetical protein
MKGRTLSATTFGLTMAGCSSIEFGRVTPRPAWNPLNSLLAVSFGMSMLGPTAQVSLTCQSSRNAVVLLGERTHPVSPLGLPARVAAADGGEQALTTGGSTGTIAVQRVLGNDGFPPNHAPAHSRPACRRNCPWQLARSPQVHRVRKRGFEHPCLRRVVPVAGRTAATIPTAREKGWRPYRVRQLEATTWTCRAARCRITIRRSRPAGFASWRPTPLYGNVEKQDRERAGRLSSKPLGLAGVQDALSQAILKSTKSK